MEKVSTEARLKKVEFLFNNSKVLNDQRKEGKFCDLTLRSKDNVQIKVHKSVISAASDFFNDLLTSGMKETSTGFVELEHITGDVLEKIVSFVYLGELEPSDSPEEIENIMKHANYFRLPKLIEVCGLFLEMCINNLNCIKYWRLARDYTLKRLSEACETYILTFDGGKLFTSLLTNFRVEEMQMLLQNDKLTGTEEEIFQAVLKWAKFRTTTDNTGDLLATLSKVVEFIRFPLMTKEFLSSTVLSNQDLAKDRVLMKKISECAEYANKIQGPFLLPKFTTPRIGSRKLELVAIYGGGGLKIADKVIPQSLEYQTCTHYKDCGYTTFGSNFLLICGGVANNNVTDVANYFSPITRKFYSFPSISRGDYSHSCVSINNKIYACGGYNSSIDSLRNRVFDLDRGEWFNGRHMKKRRAAFGLTAVNNSLYAMGGAGDCTVEMLDPRNNVGWTIIFDKINKSYDVKKCVSIENNIHCFSSNRQFIFDVRTNKLRQWGCDIDIFEKNNCKFDVCEINGEISLFAAVDNRFHFFKCDTDGEITLMRYIDGMTSEYPIIVSMYC